MRREATRASGPRSPGTTSSSLRTAPAAQRTRRLRLYLAIAVAFARSPMTLANTAWDLQRYTEGRFTLGLGSQIKLHIERRFSTPGAGPPPACARW